MSEAGATAVVMEVEPCPYCGALPCDQVNAPPAAVALPDREGWREIATDPPPHEELVLLYWMDWRGTRYMEATYASTGERYPNGYSTMSQHGSATHWMPLPEPPEQACNPLTGEALMALPAGHGGGDVG